MYQTPAWERLRRYETQEKHAQGNPVKQSVLLPLALSAAGIMTRKVDWKIPPTDTVELTFCPRKPADANNGQAFRHARAK